jgi:hemerythrin-like domain-containing protein
MSQPIDRRAFLVAGAGLVAASPLLAGLASSAPGRDPDEGATAPEDLMKEHGVLNRCLLLYEEALRRLERNAEIPPQAFHDTAELIRRFVEEYHEKNEETYIFPEFRRAGKMRDLVDTLQQQHAAGRRVTEEILRLSHPGAYRSAHRQRISHLCRQFIRMYRPHEAREDTVLFPALRTLLSPRHVALLGERMEEEEHKILGEEGFERSVEKVAALEKSLGIYDLRRFTPKS